MGGSGIGQDEEDGSEPLTSSQIFHKVFPEYLAMGMTFEQFWQQDCSMVVAYRKAYRIRQEEINRTAWLNGLYMYKALTSAPQFVQGFIPKGTKIEPYPNKPIDFTPVKPKTEQEKLDDEVKAQSEQIKRNMMRFMAAQQAEHKKKELEVLLGSNEADNGAEPKNDTGEE